MRFALAPAVITLSLCAFAANAQPTRAPLTDEERIAWLSADLKAISRTAELAADLREVRQVLLAMVDQEIEWLREPRPDGTYRWASLQREEGDRKSVEKALEKVFTEEMLHEVTVSASNAYRLLVSVPQKRSVFSSNNRTWVRNVVLDWTDFEGKSHRTDLPVNVWVAPGDAHGVALPEIGKNVHATVHLGIESGGKRAVAEVALLQATLSDDPTNPFYPAVRRLTDLRTILTRDQIRREELKTTADESLLAMPGELEKRVAAQQEAIARRKTIAISGELLGSIEIGDATPDVVARLGQIARKLTGTVEEQTTARAELDELLNLLQPPVSAAVEP